ncbi:MAG: nucleotide exchange factor GrpE [Ignavibacteria bacterium]
MNKDKKNSKGINLNEIKIERNPNYKNPGFNPEKIYTHDKSQEKKDNDNPIESEITEIPAQTTVPASENNAELKSLRDLNEALTKDVTELKDKYLRKVAEFENYKRRTEAEHMNFLKYAGETFISKILPVYDDLERSLNHINENTSVETIANGLKMIFAKFTKLMEEQGVKKIDAKGTPFDVNFHEALLQQTVKNVAPHTVIDVVEPGYTYKDKVIRHAKVIVSDENSAE